MLSPITSPPTRSSLISSDRVYLAVGSFVRLCAPDVPTKNYYAGYQNRMSLPANSNEYVVASIVRHDPHGTPIERYEYDPAVGAMSTHVMQLQEMLVQVDCYSDDPEKARMRAQSLATVCRSTTGVDFFEQFGLSALFADPPQNSTVVTDSQQYVQRWTTTLHLLYTHKISLDVESFNAIDVDVTNVEVRFPPTKN